MPYILNTFQLICVMCMEQYTTTQFSCPILHETVNVTLAINVSKTDTYLDSPQQSAYLCQLPCYTQISIVLPMHS